MRDRVPRLSLAIVTAAIVVRLAPGAGELLVYDRALVAAGQWWRLATAVLVHFSGSHLFWDAIALVGAGWLAECRGARRFALLCVATAVSSSLAVQWLQPELLWYGGLSALAYAALAFSALDGLVHDRPGRTLWIAIVAALALKVSLEFALGHAVLATADGALGVATASHLAGVAMAATVVTLDAAARAGRLRALIPALLLPLVSACTLRAHAAFATPSGQRLLAPVRAGQADGTSSVERLRVGVVVGAERATSVQPGIVMPPGSLAWPIGAAARRVAADSVARRLALDSARFASVVVLPPGVESLGRDEIGRRYGVDAICWLGYLQQVDARDDGLVLLHLATLVSPWIYPSTFAHARTVADLVVARLDGRVVLHATGTSGHRRRAIPMRTGSAVRTLRERDLAAAAVDAARQALAAPLTP